MNWYWAEGGEQRGSVTEGEFLELQRSGKIDRTTLVWHDGMANWQPAGEVATVAVPAGQGVCSECGGRFPESELVPFERTRVCAGCKPLFLQRLREGVSNSTAGAWRDGRRLVVRAGHALSGSCVKCNAPADGRPLVRKLYWHTPWLYLLVIVSILIYAIVALIVRKKARVEVGLCPRHRNHRIMCITVAWVVCLGSVVGFFAALAAEQGLLAFAIVLTGLAGLCLGNFGGRVVYATRIDDTHVWLAGVGKAFADNFPEWRGRD